jgi:ribosome biogenesis protein NSA1
MPRFLTGDELGNIKAIRYSPDAAPDATNTESKLLYGGITGGSSKGVQKLGVISKQPGLTTVRAPSSKSTGG